MSVPPIADLYTTEIYCRATSIRATYLRTFGNRASQRREREKEREDCLLQFGPIFHFFYERKIFESLFREMDKEEDKEEKKKYWNLCRIRDGGGEGEVGNAIDWT